MGEYSAVAAKLKAMHAGFLTADDFNELLTKKTVGDICAYLKGTRGYRDPLSEVNESDVHRGEIELILAGGLLDEYIRLYNFMNQKQRKMLYFWFMRHEISYIERELRHLYVHDVTSASFQSQIFDRFFAKHSKINRDIMVNAKSIEDCMEACKETPYYDILQRAYNIKADMFSIGMMLDSTYYRMIWKMKDAALDRTQKAPFASTLGSKIDMQNIMWIYRGKKYFHFDPDLIFTYLIPVRYKLSEDDIRNMVKADSVEQMLLYVNEHTKYRELFKGVEHGIFPEENYRVLEKRIAKHTFVNHPETMAAVAAYLELKEIEIENIYTIIEGVRYNLNPDDIREHVGLS